LVFYRRKQESVVAMPLAHIGSSVASIVAVLSRSLPFSCADRLERGEPWGPRVSLRVEVAL
jgi:hypothetical protein